jgi:hypothetical protein
MYKLDIPVETGVFSGKASDEYVVLTPLGDSFELFADNLPQYETQEARISLFSKKNYIRRKQNIVNAVLERDLTVTNRRYIEHEDDSGYHHYVIDVAKNFEHLEAIQSNGNSGF